MRENIGYCPKCRKVVFRRGTIELKDGNKLSFQTRCPHCGEELKVEIGAEINIYIYNQ